MKLRQKKKCGGVDQGIQCLEHGHSVGDGSTLYALLPSNGKKSYLICGAALAQIPRSERFQRPTDSGGLYFAVHTGNVGKTAEGFHIDIDMKTRFSVSADTVQRYLPRASKLMDATWNTPKN